MPAAYFESHKACSRVTAVPGIVLVVSIYYYDRLNHDCLAAWPRASYEDGILRFVMRGPSLITSHSIICACQVSIRRMSLDQDISTVQSFILTVRSHHV